MKGIYLAAHIAEHKNYDIIYQDITGKRDIGGDMLDIDLTPYDFIIATPPCNYWSRARGNRQPSQYALDTKHLLSDILDKLKKLDKPYIVENVRNEPLFKQYDILNKADYVYYIGRHTYFTNIPFNASDLTFGSDNVKNISSKNRQGGKQVFTVIERWLSVL